ncbi:peptidoglycan DD-metalloendopeptidase family protein [Halomonas garicola]|uniref:peptidoglycan DD-metalloendopeptidase family protein n=1 Tax=Halomonas garicola TaxID=1690008 RepID=UPI0028996349|nr:peptidoglycan DD-metalloendopeptidase family protein [Halomonas garicola]
MRKIFVMSVLALAIAGCANQQQSRPQVRDVSDAQQAVESTPGYTVKAGDTLYGIAWEHNLDYRRLAALNDIDPPYNIYPGQKIRLRQGEQTADDRRLAGADTAAKKDSKAVTTGLDASSGTAGQGGADSQEVDWLLPDEPVTADKEERQDEDRNKNRDKDQKPAVAESEKDTAPADRDADRSDDKADKADKAAAAKDTADDTGQVATAGESQEADKTEKAAASAEKRDERSYTPAKTIDWQWPVNGELVGRFDDDAGITAGIDIAGEKGQSVKAAGPGIVVYAGSGVRGYGNLVLLKHNDQFLSAYAHNDSLNVSENDVIKAGEVIATMGSSDAESVRLHFEVRKDGEPQDPLEYLPSR